MGRQLQLVLDLRSLFGWNFFHRENRRVRGHSTCGYRLYLKLISAKRSIWAVAISRALYFLTWEEETDRETHKERRQNFNKLCIVLVLSRKSLLIWSRLRKSVMAPLKGWRAKRARVLRGTFDRVPKAMASVQPKDTARKQNTKSLHLLSNCTIFKANVQIFFWQISIVWLWPHPNAALIDWLASSSIKQPNTLSINVELNKWPWYRLMSGSVPR